MVVKDKEKETSCTERVHFRLFLMPCCAHLFCGVNHRIPNFCPECGERVFARIKADPSCIQISDTEATLKYKSR